MKHPLNSNPKPIKILSIHWGFSAGGIAKYAFFLQETETKSSLRINSLCIIGRKWGYDNILMEKLNAEIIVINSRADISWIWKVRDTIKALKPDLIMTHGFNGHFVVLLTKLLLRNLPPQICSYHGATIANVEERRPLRGIFIRMTEHFIRRHALEVVAVSNFTKNYLAKKNIRPDKIEVIYNGVGISTASNDARVRLRKEWNVRDGDILVGIISRLRPVKGVAYLIDALALLAEKYLEIKLVIVGTGKQEEELKRKVIALGLSKRVIFAGFRSDVDDCLEAFDIFVLPSLIENHSIALLEAMRSRKAIVATNVGGNPESVRHGKEGLLVQPTNTNDLAEALEKLVINKAICESLAARAFIRFQKEFTVETMVQSTADWLLKCGRIAMERKCGNI